MAVKSKEEILETIKGLLGDRTDDDAITVVEDINDTFADYDNRLSDDWKAKYEQNDAAWRKRYRDRFYAAEDDGEKIEDEKIVEEKKTYDDLFTRKEN